MKKNYLKIMRDNHPSYASYNNMKTRCYQSSHQGYKHYGGRGIQVCDRWMKGFKYFLADMGERPKGLTLDRINPYGDYCKENCRWVDYKTQANNKRSKK